jgi:hypothetical protein
MKRFKIWAEARHKLHPNQGTLNFDAQMDDQIQIGDEVTYTPKNTRMEEPATGYVADIIQGSAGDTGYEIIIHGNDFASRLWSHKGTFAKTGKKADWKQPEKVATPVQTPQKPYKHPSDLAMEYKKRGLNRQLAWDQFVKDTILQPQYRSEKVDAKVFYHYYDAS